VDGEVVASTSEERFTREKNDDRWPHHAIAACLKISKLGLKDIDYIAIASYKSSISATILTKYKWGVQEYLDEQYEIWRPFLVDNKDKKSYFDVFSDWIDVGRFPKNIEKKYFYDGSDEQYSNDRSAIVSQITGIAEDKVGVIEHHRSHAAYSYYASHFRGEKILSFTVDGWGDGKNATIGVFDEKGNYQEHYSTDQCAIGRIYRYMTLLLGMKPNEHEFKVMGLAPYGKKKYAQQALDLFKSTLYVDGTEFKWNTKPTDSYFWFKERLEGVRFDNIAYALQTWVEDLLIEWVSNAIAEYDIHKIVVSGGVAMNIKAMGKIAALDCVDDIFIGGSASDESLAIGSAICLAEDLTKEGGKEWDSSTVSSLPHLYLGPDATTEDEQTVVSQARADADLTVIRAPSNEKIADLLADGNVIARCAGRMEFGQRALGNRSILADPSDLRVKDKINAMIKSRDFWMPFAPIVLDDFVDRYLVNPKKLSSPHMTIGFDTTPEGFDAMIAACHPADKTARAQILKRESNPDVYDLIKAFEQKTGRGAILNTSFNLHGYPIVNTPQEAYDVFNRSGLDGLLLKSHLILKNDTE